MPPLIFRPALLSRRGGSISIHICGTRQPSRIQARFNSTTPTTTITTTEAIKDANPIEEDTTEKTETNTPKPRRKKRLTEPLRILFCGSDAFSCASLRALHALQLSDPKGKLIKSIDVLVRPGKPAGRGLKRIAVGPLFHLAEELGLPIHRRDTFTGWDLPPAGHITHHETGKIVKHRAAHENSHKQPFNLIVAVSFGLFVPPRVLNTVRYGGINVHPSILPDLRGPAPLQHAILYARRRVGATLQTLHHNDFDRGDVLLQTPYPPGIPVREDCDVQELHDILAEEGARLLVEGLERDLHAVPPGSVKGGWRPSEEEMARGLVRDAPKVRKADAEVDWGCRTWGRDKELYPEGWGAADLARRFRAVGVKLGGDGQAGLWTRAITARYPTEKRMIFEDVRAVRCPERLRDVAGDVLIPKEVSSVVFSMVDQSGTQKPEEFRLPYIADGTAIILPIKVQYAMFDGVVSTTIDASYMDAVRIESIKVEGSKSKLAAHAMAEFKEDKLTMRDISSLDFTMDIMTKLVE
ncbi:Methionyl-tRNA formyltransferase, mitochondrial [Cytospora mali]|uniref:methionyl-tRNA formyltransferase n=1 Tax=Cytospora mali TaxID=578113 RepID=A0A194UUV6_CYTMA|nr:Methionyl-tRNA formyltransferase, mitochondrial [Valsa mali var. pyri (nom. inval.)]